MAPRLFVAGHFVATRVVVGQMVNRKRFVVRLLVAFLITGQPLSLYRASKKLIKELNSDFNDI